MYYFIDTYVRHGKSWSIWSNLRNDNIISNQITLFSAKIFKQIYYIYVTAWLKTKQQYISEFQHWRIQFTSL